MPLVALSSAPAPARLLLPPYPALCCLSFPPPGLPPSSLVILIKLPHPPLLPGIAACLLHVCTFIHSSCTWPEASCFSHSCRTASAPACRAVGIGPAREMCHRSYQREARLWQWAGLTGRLHYDSFTCRGLFAPAGSNLDRCIPNTFPHNPSPFPCG
ncbi:hypothetical protein BGX38DRAFT_544554 [Terfezia claveryi]|nr:hypothetical protein BGX38DRAFT_544554 [Terfezia claveryi]